MKRKNKTKTISIILILAYINLHLPHLLNGASFKEANQFVNELKILPSQVEVKAECEEVVEVDVCSIVPSGDEVNEENKGEVDMAAEEIIPNYRDELKSRYDAYALINDTLELSEVVYEVNLNLDIEPYTNINEIEDFEAIDVLVNKYNQLPRDYIPKDLVTLDVSIAYEGRMVREIILDDLLEMFDAAKVDGYELIVLSAFRSYLYQEEVYLNYVDKSGQEKADTFSARPGHSEHQTGLCVDLVKKNNGGLGGFVGSVEAEWVKEHAHEYGFVITYPEHKIEITRYMHEPWHIRYVGRELALYLHQFDLTLDEYHALKEVE
jgi:D-alanyl-D-alanine carboxypeptidase